MGRKVKNNQAESNTRIASYEAQLQHQHHELELERNRAQELMVKLTESRNELSHCLEREKQQSEIISSLEYQFAELNAQKQRLIEEVTASKALNESAVNELRAQVISLTSDLMRANTDLQAAQLRADSLANELECARADMAAATAKRAVVADHADAGVCTDTVVGNEQPPELPRKQSSDKVEYESRDTVKQLRHQLAAVQKDYQNATRDLDGARHQQQVMAMELEHYKATLLETEALLGKLQDFAAEAEQKWRLLLADSEAERAQLATRLAEANNKTAEVTQKLNEAERKLAKQTKGASNAPSLANSKKTNRKQDSRRARRSSKCDDATAASSSNTDATRSEPSGPQVVKSTEVASPTCVDEPVAPVTAQQDSTVAKLSANQASKSGIKRRTNTVSRLPPKTQPDTEQQPTAFECQEVEGTWIALSPSRMPSDTDHGPRVGSDGLFHVTARAVSDARWTSSVHELKTSDLVIPADTDTDGDFDAVLVDDTDLHVADDIWDSVTKCSENSPADSHCDAPSILTDRTAAPPITTIGEHAGDHAGDR